MKTLVVALLHGTVVGAFGNSCVITARHCQNFPQFSGGQFQDSYGEQLIGAKENAATCVRRAEDFHHWCGNGRQMENATVAATYTPDMTSQIYHPTACPAQWSLYHKNCYIHVWRAKTWWDAEAWCNLHGGHLCSIHGKAENEFVFTLTKGLTSWIGYQDQDQDEEHTWTDNTPSDYENRAADCAGRESDPDCQPKEQAQKWFDWEGHDRATWVCKKPARWSVALMRNTTSLEALALENWESYKRDIPPRIDVQKAHLEAREADALPALDRVKLDLGEKKDADPTKCTNC